MDRFEREARLLAQLNHSNIATLHGLEEHDGQKFLVMELVEGETLAERIAKVPVPIDAALPLFIQIAEGLEAAHEKAIIHRDLKPANIKIGADGKPKILDFGLAKAFVGKQDSAADSSQSPTLTKGTALGAIMGTAGYMSPEQASGGNVDARADIWAFGCCLYESLTGKRTFTGESAPQILASVLKDEPDWDALPGDLAANVSLLLRRCLEKNVRSRLQNVGDARIELAETLSPPATLPPLSSRRTTSSAGTRPWLWAAAAALVAFAAGVIFRGVPSGPDARAAEPIKLSIVVPADLNLISTIDTGSFEISRDGSSIVVAAARAQKRQLFARALSERQFRPIEGTEGVEDSKFVLSPDGEWVGFYRDSKLWKTRLDGGVPVALFEGPPVWHPHWAADGWIYFAAGATSGLFRIPDSGGEPEVLTELDREKNEVFHGSGPVARRSRPAVRRVRRQLRRLPSRSPRSRDGRAASH